MRPQGGIIGVTVTPTTSAASGIWTLREAERFKRGGTWPAAATAPGAPTSVSGTAGNAQVALTWTAPTSNGGSAITGYVVEYTPSGGSASTVSTGSTSASYTVTGLTNDTAYTFRVAAVNAVGAGSYSTASASVTPVAGSALSVSKNGNTVNGSGTSANPYTFIAINQTVNGVGGWFKSPFTASRSCTVYVSFTKPNGDGGLSWGWATSPGNDYYDFGFEYANGGVYSRTFAVTAGTTFYLSTFYNDGTTISVYAT